MGQFVRLINIRHPRITGIVEALIGVILRAYNLDDDDRRYMANISLPSDVSLIVQLWIEDTLSPKTYSIVADTIFLFSSSLR